MDGAAGGEIAHTDHRQSGIERFGVPRLEGDTGAVKPAQRRQEGGAQCPAQVAEARHVRGRRLVVVEQVRVHRV